MSFTLPYFSGLGKDAKSILSKGYNCGNFRLGLKSKTSTGVEIASNISTNMDTYEAFGTLETNYIMERGKLLVKLDTNNIFSAEVTFTDVFVMGAEISLDCSIGPHEGYRSSHMKGSFSNDIYSLNTSVDMDPLNPTMTTSAVAGCNCWIGGIQAVIDLKNKNMIKKTIAGGYLSEDFILNISLDKEMELKGSIYQKINPALEIGIQVASSPKTTQAELSIGCQYKLDAEAAICAKGSSSGQISFGYRQKLHEGIILYLSSLCNITNCGTGQPNLGLALDFEL